MSKPDTSLPKGYAALRIQYPETILFFEVGESLEAFDGDADKVSEITGIGLTRLQDHTVCGFTRKQLDSHLPKFVKHFKVAVCRPLSKAEAKDLGLAPSGTVRHSEYQLTLF